MYGALIAIHLIVCIIMILVVISQSSKGSEMGAVFGGGASQTAFGSQGAAGFLEKTTVVCAVVFMITSLSLAVLSSNRQKSLIQDTPPPPIEQSIPESVPEQVPVQSQSAAPEHAAPAPSQSGNAPQQAAPAAAGSAPAAPAAPASSAPANTSH
ncbi:MAG: preprotein translocase subunit SecG [bacterium]